MELTIYLAHDGIRDLKYTELMKQLEAQYDPEAIAGMARYGINPSRVYGVPISKLRIVAKEIGRDHRLAQQLWTSGVHDARMLACLIDNPKEVSEAQMERWASDFDSWALCDSCCGHLLDKTELAHQKAAEWVGRNEEMVKRAGFSLMATLAVHDKKATDEVFEQFLLLIKRESTDERNLVKKAVNWSLRQIGKRNRSLNQAAIETASEIQQIDSNIARWIASDALRELTSESAQQRLRNRDLR